MSSIGELGPSSVEADLKDGPHKTPGRLGNIEINPQVKNYVAEADTHKNQGKCNDQHCNNSSTIISITIGILLTYP